MSTLRDILTPLTGYASPEAASFLAQLDDQLRLLRDDLKGITAEEIGWQMAPGTNTVGMLLAHLAIVEVHWTQVGLLGHPTSDSMPVLGIGIDDDGMPVPPGGAPPANLVGKPMAYFDDLLDRGRAYVKQTAIQLTPADLDKVRSRVRKDGKTQELNGRWVLYHLLEHFAGHYGQILLLRHQFRDAMAGSSPPR